MSFPTIEILTLLQLPRVGPNTVREIIQRFDDEGVPFGEGALLDFARRQFAHKVPSSSESFSTAREEARRIVEQCGELGIGILTFADDNFPHRLRQLSQAPVAIYVLGKIEAISRRESVAVVGTRSPTPYGEERGIWAGAGLSRLGFVVVSGLALGCDTLAHTGTVRAGGHTVAVLAHGLDTVSPASNRGLAREILEKGGALVSEYPPGTRAFRQNFIQRDRLQIGLAAGLLVIETDVQGGTMHTVGFCRDQGKVLSCIDHPRQWWSQEKTRGNRMLLQQRVAYSVSNDEDLAAFAEYAVTNEGTVGGFGKRILGT